MFKTTLTLNLQSFIVPESVCEIPAHAPPGEYVHTPRSFALSEIPAGTLAAMCDEFRKEIFKRAKSKDPTLAPPLGHKGPKPSAAYRASQLVALVTETRHTLGLTATLEAAALKGLVHAPDGLNVSGDVITVELTPSIEVRFRK